MASERKQIVLRLDPRLVKEIDREAGNLGLSRQLLCERLLRHGLIGFKAGKEADAAGLFEEFERDLAGVIEDALRKAVREGGPDLAIWRASQAKKGAKKGAKRAR